MPLLKASKKALRNARRKETRNALQTRRLKEALRRVSEKDINIANSLIDKAAKNHLLHPNKAARLKARIAKKVGATPQDKSKVKGHPTSLKLRGTGKSKIQVKNKK